MALAITSNYAGDVVEEIATLLVTQNQTVAGGHVHIETNIFKQRSIPRGTIDNVIQDRLATPVSLGTYTQDERVLLPGEFMVYVEFNPNDFRDVWEPFQPSGDFVFSELAPQVQTTILKLVLEGTGGVQPYLGNAIWQGDLAGAAPLNKFDGFETKATADADVLDVSTPIALTAGNIIAEIGRLYDLVPVPVRADPAFKIFMGETDKELYWDALIALANKGRDPSEAQALTFKGKPIVPLVGVTKDRMFGTKADTSRGSNLWFGLTGTNDTNTMRVDRLQANSELFFVKMIMGADTQIKFGQELVNYG